MWFWVFIMIHCILIPVLMTGFGRLFQKRPPAQINSVYGYRTKMSKINMDTWDYAHRYFGKQWFRAGCLMFPGTVLCMLFLLGRNEEEIGIAGTVIITIQVIILILPVIKTEKELRRKFDLDGTRRQI